MKIKNREGFTLIEVIMSIAILSIASVIVLQLFVVAGNLNDYSVDMDYAGIIAANAIESAKAYTREEAKAMSKDYVIHFDADWHEVDGEDTYMLILNMTEDSEYNGLYEIDAVVTDNDSAQTLVQYRTSYYYHVKE